ncbi:hypothetical protein L598_006200000080 [Mesorhizobium sp. J18]|nr:hypothetical protein L598_006200000080 [Mesorhizobium sp. J18]
MGAEAAGSASPGEWRNGTAGSGWNADRLLSGCSKEQADLKVVRVTGQGQKPLCRLKLVRKRHRAVGATLTRPFWLGGVQRRREGCDEVIRVHDV